MLKLIDLKDYELQNRELKKYIDNSIAISNQEQIVYKDSYLKFPTIGNPDSMYVDTTLKIIYGWNNDTMNYFKIAESIENLKVIDGLNGFLEN